MQVKLEPKGRFVWEGQTVHYKVKAEGARELSLSDKVPEGLEARITNVRQVAGGVEGDLTVEMVGKQPV